MGTVIERPNTAEIRRLRRNAVILRRPVPVKVYSPFLCGYRQRPRRKIPPGPLCSAAALRVPFFLVLRQFGSIAVIAAYDHPSFYGRKKNSMTIPNKSIQIPGRKRRFFFSMALPSFFLILLVFRSGCKDRSFYAPFRTAPTRTVMSSSWSPARSRASLSR